MHQYTSFTARYPIPSTRRLTGAHGSAVDWRTARYNAIGTWQTLAPTPIALDTSRRLQRRVRYVHTSGHTATVANDDDLNDADDDDDDDGGDAS